MPSSAEEASPSTKEEATPVRKEATRRGRHKSRRRGGGGGGGPDEAAAAEEGTWVAKVKHVQREAAEHNDAARAAEHARIEARFKMADSLADLSDDELIILESGLLALILALILALTLALALALILTLILTIT